MPPADFACGLFRVDGFGDKYGGGGVEEVIADTDRLLLD